MRVVNIKLQRYKHDSFDPSDGDIWPSSEHLGDLVEG